MRHLLRGYSSVGRALAWHARGQRFESAYLPHNWIAAPSSRGLGHDPFTVGTGVRIPVGTPNHHLIPSQAVWDFLYLLEKSNNSCLRQSPPFSLHRKFFGGSIGGLPLKWRYRVLFGGRAICRKSLPHYPICKFADSKRTEFISLVELSGKVL